MSRYKLILTSNGLNTYVGRDLVKTVFQKEKLNPKSIFLVVPPDYQVDEILVRACEEIGFQHICLSGNFEGAQELPDVDCYYVTEGNTFEVLDYMRKNHFNSFVKHGVENGALYIGSSAGAIIASYDIKLADYFDLNFVRMTDFHGLEVMEERDTIIPHYTYPQLQRFLKELKAEEKDAYSQIYNCANGEALIMDMVSEGQHAKLLRKRRIRLEEKLG